MTFADFLLHLFYLIDTELKILNPPIRKRGPQPRLSDAEIIVIELAGEFLGIDTDKHIWTHFRRYHLAEFPMLACTDRTRFVRHSADLWRIKQILLERLAARTTDDPLFDRPLLLVDSFPLRVCRFKRAPGHKLFRASAAYGRDPTGEKLFFGFRVHLACNAQGLCVGMTLAPANITDWPLVSEIVTQRPALALGDRNYWNPDGQPILQDQQIQLIAPFRKKSSDPDPIRSSWITKLRQIIEPVIGQLATRFHCQRTWARDLWHLTSRLTRKILSHTAAVLINQRQGNPMLQLEGLIRE
jgi:hypothetical protein